MVPSLIFLDRKRDVASDEERSSARTCESTPPLFFAATRRFATPCRKVLFVCCCCGTFMHLVERQLTTTIHHGTQQIESLTTYLHVSIFFAAPRTSVWGS